MIVTMRQLQSTPGPASSFSVAGKVVVVTGSVGNLGLAVVRRAQEAGARTVLIDRSEERLRKTFPEIEHTADHLFIGGIDLTDPNSVARIPALAIERYGRIDALVNTVGAWRGGENVHEEDLANWDFLFTMNVRTTLLTCRAIVPQMLKQQSGRIVNVASRGALMGDAGSSAYSAAKSAVIRLTESLADELKGASITANAVLPGTIDTPQNREAMPRADHAKWIAPEAIADVILFLASDASRAITGAALPVFGKA